MNIEKKTDSINQMDIYQESDEFIVEEMDPDSLENRLYFRGVADGTFWDALMSDANQPNNCDDFIQWKYFLYCHAIETWMDLRVGEAAELIPNRDNEFLAREIEKLINEFGRDAALSTNALVIMEHISYLGYMPMSAFLYNFLSIAEVIESKTGFHDERIDLLRSKGYHHPPVSHINITLDKNGNLIKNPLYYKRFL